MITNTCASMLRKQAGWQEQLTSLGTTGGGAALGGLGLWGVANLLGLSKPWRTGAALTGILAGGYGGNRLGKHINANRFADLALKLIENPPNDPKNASAMANGLWRRFNLSSNGNFNFSPEALGEMAAAEETANRKALADKSKADQIIRELDKTVARIAYNDKNWY